MKIYNLFIANLKRFWRDPTALFFTIFFPLIFLLIFGAIFSGDGSNFVSKVAMFNNSDTEFAANFIQQSKDDPSFNVEEFTTYEEAEESLTRSQIDAIIVLPEDFGKLNAEFLPSGELEIQYLESSSDDSQALVAIMGQVLSGINQGLDPYDPPFKVKPNPLSAAALEPIDYLVPGILGFSVMSLAIFGMANGFTSDKKTGAIARLRATPIRSYHVAIATGLVYIVLGMISIAILTTVAITVYGFEMIGDWLSFIIMILIGIVSLYGIGLIIGGWAKNDKQAIPIAQLVGLPMMFLSGVFFPRFLMPEWLQEVSSILPLTALNEGLRLIASEGFNLFDIGTEILILVIWGVIAYPIAFKLFRWE